MHSLLPLTPEESLYAFMDGELDVDHEQGLFDALAGDVSLRREMKDLLTIRSAVYRDVIAPPPTVESRILAGAGLLSAGGTAAGTAAASATSTAVATAVGGSRFPWSHLGVGLSGMVAGIILSMFLFDSGSDVTQPVTGESITATSTPTDTPPEKPQVTLTPPAAQQASAPTIVYIYRDRPVDAATEASVDALTPVPAEPEIADGAAEATMIERSEPRPIQLGMTSAYTPMPAASMIRDQYPSPLADVHVRMRALPSGVNSTEPMPASIRQTLMANQAFGVSIPIDSRQRIGLEVANESFRQVFGGTVDARSVTYTQTPTLFWLGATYAVRPFDSFVIPGLQPFAELMLGSVIDQGPITHGTLGLVYRPAGPIAVTAGLNGSAMFYRHASNWYTSTKWGLTYGIMIDLGRLP